MNTSFDQYMTILLNNMVNASDMYTMTFDRESTSKDEGFTCPPIDRVIFNGDHTIVWFKDNTKTMVKRSPVDKDDRQTSIVYAIVKRMFGKRKDDGTVDSYGFYSWISKLAKNGFDQQLAEATEKERKAEARAKNAAKQRAEQEAAMERRIRRRAEEILVEREAEKMLNDATTKVLCESPECKCKSKIKKALTESTNDSGSYVKPNKKFKDFSQSEKRAYWRDAAKRRRKA